MAGLRLKKKGSTVLTTVLSVKNLVAQILAKDAFVVLDTETADPGGLAKGALILHRPRILIVSMKSPSMEKPASIITTFCHPSGMDAAELIEALRPLAESKKIKKWFHNANYDQNVFLNHGLEFKNAACTLLYGHAQDRNLAGSLKERAPLVGFFLRKTGTVDFSNLSDIAAYAGEDAGATEALTLAQHNPKHELYVHQRPRWFYENIDWPVQQVVLGMERRGIRLDIARLRNIENQMTAKLKDLYAFLYRTNGGPFNLRSTPELRNFLFERLKVTPHKWTGGGDESTAADQLKLSQHEHPAIGKILEIRQIEKLLGTYVSAAGGLPSYCDDAGVLHPSFNVAATVTGRLASSNPNAQNIPSKTDTWGIRNCFIPRPGYVLIVIDYSQMELRMLAVLSQDPVMVELYGNPDTDIHSVTAAACGVDRNRSKSINFGLIYGMGAGKLAYVLTMAGFLTSKMEAEDYIRKFFKTYARLIPYREETWGEHFSRGFIEYLSGRTRCIPTLHSETAPGHYIAGAQRELLNNHDQGSCADWVRSAMLRSAASRELKSLDAHLLLQVHDELVFEVREKHATAAKTEIERIMMLPTMTYLNRPPTRELNVKFIAEGGIGPSWKEAKT